ncbi:MAG: pyruvate kinase [Pseudomonadota bacterium]
MTHSDSPNARSMKRLFDEVTALRERVERGATDWLAARGIDHPRTDPAAWNLACYLALRSEDIRTLQSALAEHGLSSLGRSESRVMATLDAILDLLERTCGRTPDREPPRSEDFHAGTDRLAHHTRELFGPDGRGAIRIMVTLPSEAADDAELLQGLLMAGMDCARINCAHDSPQEWTRMLDHLAAARRRTGRHCRVLMDLAGHKVRTGPIAPRETVLEMEWEDGRAPVIEISDGFAVSEAVSKGRRRVWHLALSPERIQALHDGQTLHFVDRFGRQRRLAVSATGTARFFRASLDAPAHVDQTTLFRDPESGETFTARGFDHRPAKLRVFEGDLLRLTGNGEPGRPARIDNRGDVVEPARVACEEPEVFAYLAEGDPVWIDDGKIGARVESIDREGALLRVEHAGPQGRNVKPDKGLNFPETPLDLPALSAKDLEDLDFVARHADMVGFSFVESGDDMRVLMQALDARGAPPLPIVAKIETRRAVTALPDILLAAMGTRPLGVMIARGDLAVELGPECLIEAQETLLCLAEAAQVPVIWATQVLETLAKKGAISRPELTDAAMAERAECVMLNKGPYIERAVRTLSDILERAHHYQYKKTARMLPLHWPDEIRPAGAVDPGGS